MSSKVVKKPSAPEEFWWIPLYIMEQLTAEEGDNLLTNTSAKLMGWLRPDQHEMELVNVLDNGKYIVVNPGSIGKFSN